MSILYERLASLCELNNITGYRMCKDCRLSPSTMTDLKNGRKKSLSADSARRIAAYFGVSVSYLLGVETENPPTNDELELAEYLQDLREHPERRLLLDASRGMTKEQVKKMAALVETFRGGE